MCRATARGQACGVTATHNSLRQCRSASLVSVAQPRGICNFRLAGGASLAPVTNKEKPDKDPVPPRFSAHRQTSTHLTSTRRLSKRMSCDKVARMPRISRFFGITVAMFYNDHAPPHFHAFYGEYETVISIETLEIREGSLPRRALALVLEWAAIHRGDLMADWERARQGLPLESIEPLE
jgi:hypothetical protein